MENFYSLSEVSKEIKIKPHRIIYAITNEFVEVHLQYFCGKRMFSTEDIEILKNYFSEKNKK